MNYVLNLLLACRIIYPLDAGWSSLAARRAHNPKVVGSNPAPATSYAHIGIANVDEQA